MRDQFVINNPSSELVPFIDGSAVDRDPPFNKLILARLQVGDDLLCDLSEVTSLDIIVGLQENFPEP